MNCAVEKRYLTSLINSKSVVRIHPAHPNFIDESVDDDYDDDDDWFVCDGGQP